MRSLTRWSSLSRSSGLRAFPRGFRGRYSSSLSTAGPAVTEASREASAPSPSSEGPIAGPSTLHAPSEVEEVIIALASEASVLFPKSVKSKRKHKQFKPINVSVKGRVDSKSTPAASGTLLDGSFKPLQGIKAGRKKHIPKLKHGLDAVLEREGVHWLRDPETKVYNFPEYLETIPRVEDFAFDRLPGFVPSSQDKSLVSLAKRAKCSFAGSTSSLTGILTQIYLLLSEEKYVNITSLSTEFKDAPRFFTAGQRIPVSVILRYQEGVYTTDNDAERDECSEEMILLRLGTLLEKFLTLPKEEFDQFRTSYTADHYPILKDTHRYSKYGQFLMRSQLDCHHPGTGVFDLKTRAISAIRHDVYNYLNYLDQGIGALTGRYGSFESEYYDMMRSAFLEYSFQARIGNMDGVMVAYHNTAQIFGFQYVSLRDMDLALFGRSDAGTRVFLRCVALMELLYHEIAKCFPRKSVKVTFEKRGELLRAWVEPVENPNEGGDAPVVELQLSVKNIMHGKEARGGYAVYASYPWTVQYSIERSTADQETIRRNRERAYARQVSIAHSLPNSRGLTLDSESLSAPSSSGEAVEAAIADVAAESPQDDRSPL
ncbi:Pet127-domain-containing protein [Pilatotrama ljubarskyi]|nr:Pet127-domain-containing protein [Pilatotrama ljubarskyi]